MDKIIHETKMDFTPPFETVKDKNADVYTRFHFEILDRHFKKVILGYRDTFLKTYESYVTKVENMNGEEESLRSEYLLLIADLKEKLDAKLLEWEVSKKNRETILDFVFRTNLTIVPK